MSVFAKRQLAKECHAKLRESTEWAVLLDKWTDILNTGNDLGGWTQVFYQYFTQAEHYYNDIYDTYLAVMLYTQIQLGNLLTTRIAMPSGPFADTDFRGNNQLLQQYLPPAFTGEFHRNNRNGDDGVLLWRDGTIFTRRTQPTPVRSHCVPLEVGYTNAYTTYKHLIAGQGLARYPYGREYIYVLLWSEQHINRLREYPVLEQYSQGLLFPDME